MALRVFLQPPPEPVTKKKIKGNKAARSQAKRFNEGLKVAACPPTGSMLLSLACFLHLPVEDREEI